MCWQIDLDQFGFDRRTRKVTHNRIVTGPLDRAANPRAVVHELLLKTAPSPPHVHGLDLVDDGISRYDCRIRCREHARTGHRKRDKNAVS